MLPSYLALIFVKFNSMIIDFIKKIVKSIKNMITEDNIAAAQIAQIFGSELLKVQQSVSESKSHPDIVKLNPKQFLVGQQNFDRQRKLEEQQLIDKINREAEMMHPLPQPTQPTPPPQSTPFVYSSSPNGGARTYVPPPATTQQNADVLVLIANFLDRIATKLESVDIKTKRKTIKRKPKSNKKVLLNENNV